MHTYSEHQFPSLKNCHATHLRVTKTKQKKGENAEVGNYQIRYLNVPPSSCVPDDVLLDESGRGREEAYLLG